MAMQDTVAVAAPPPRRFRVIVLTIILVAIAFLAGYVPKDLEARRLRAELKQAELDLRLANLHRQLGVASHEAQRNNYSVAASSARAFFDGCGAVASSEPFENQPRTRAALAAYAASKDKILGELAVGDPVVKQRLAGLYLAMEGVLQRRI